jgi:hypothetical protein
MPRRKRDYAKEYRDYQGTPEQIKRRAQRNAARRKMEVAGRVHKGDGKEVDHKNFNTANNSNSNLRVVSRSVNRRKQPKRS